MIVLQRPQPHHPLLSALSQIRPPVEQPKSISSPIVNNRQSSCLPARPPPPVMHPHARTPARSQQVGFATYISVLYLTSPILYSTRQNCRYLRSLCCACPRLRYSSHSLPSTTPPPLAPNSNTNDQHEKTSNGDYPRTPKNPVICPCNKS